MNQICVLGDCLEVMREYPDNSVDSIVTDPPYGLSFMGKKWDYDVPSVEIWKQALRVLKPGGHLLAFGGTRTYHRLVIAIEDAGFEIRDQIQWLYGSGFPKSHNIKEGEFKGFGTALKPANEPICLARKPLDGTVAQNFEKWGVGGLNIDESRIGTEERYNAPASSLGNSKTMDGGAANPNHEGTITQGRWPANLLLDETAAQMLDEQSSFHISYDNKADRTYKNDKGASRFFQVIKDETCESNSANTAAMILKPLSRLEGFVADLVATLEAHEDVWLNDTLLPFILATLTELKQNEKLNTQTIQTIEQRLKRELRLIAKYLNDHANIAEARTLIDTITTIQDHLTSSSYVEAVISLNTLMNSERGEKDFANRFLYQAKASKRERNAGLEGMPEHERQRQWAQSEGRKDAGQQVSSFPQANNHPTVKPIKLMEYLIKLITPAGGIVLDPFMGSGSTGVAAKNLGFSFIGIEMNQDYVNIAEKRIEAA